MKHICSRIVGVSGLRIALAAASLGVWRPAVSVLAVAVSAAAVMSPALVATAVAEEGGKHPIDKWYDAAMDKAGSTAETREVIGKALEKWDAELNLAYKDMMSRLSPAGKDALKAAQLQWIKFRDAEMALMKESIYALDGTMWLQVGDIRVMKLTRDRALQLRANAQTMSEGGS